MSLLSPHSVAVVGASATPGKVGHEIFKNLVTQGFAGTVYPINPKPDPILGHATYASVKDLPEAVDLVVIVTPAATVAGILRECAEKKVPSVIVISAGFGETGSEEGHRLEHELIEIVRANQQTSKPINVVGPNCLGLVRPSLKLNASFAAALPPTGSIGLVTQSGAMGVALMDSAASFGLGLSLVLSVGNKALLDECDYVELLEHDDETKVIGLYLESVKDGRRFLEEVTRVNVTKPIVLLKSGVSQAGSRAASSHTGALAGSDAAIEALCAQSGIRRAHTTEEFLDLLAVLSKEPALLSPRIAIITNAGGPGILATDAAEPAGLILATPSPKTKEVLSKALPAAASSGNPIDVLGDAGADRYAAALEACADDPEIDGCAVLLTPQVMTPCDEIARTVASVLASSPLMPVVTAFMGGDSVREAKRILRESGIPAFATPERAIAALGALLPRPRGTRPLAALSTERSQRANALLDGISGLVPEDVTEQLLAVYDLPMPKQGLATSADEAVAIARDIGLPVIAKISSPQILHKTDVGGIRANLKTEEEVRVAYEEIMKNMEKFRVASDELTLNSQLETRNSPPYIRGVLIQRFLPIGDEFIVGALRDPSFGPMIMVGLGGIYTELFRDTCFRIAPVDTETVYEMLVALRSWKLLLGLRGKAQSDIDTLARFVATMSSLAAECPRICELDVNPVLVGPTGIVIADVKIVLD